MRRTYLTLTSLAALAAALILAGGCAKEAAPEQTKSVPTPDAAVAEAVSIQPAPSAETAPLAEASPAPAGAVKWAASFAEATKRAKIENKPIMVDFWATWCGWCKKLDSDVYSTGEFARAAQNIVSVKVNAEGEERAVAEKYGVGNLPTVLYLTPDGKVLGRVGGYMPVERFVPTVTAAAELYRSIPGLKAKFAADPNDWDAAQRMVEISARLDDAEGAEKAVARIQTLDPDDKKKFRARSLLLLGDMYARAGKIEKATPLFEQAAATSKEPDESAAARRAAAMCYAMQKKFSKAATLLQAIVDAPDASEERKQEARQLLERLQKETTIKPG